MAVAQASSHLFDRINMKAYDFDPDSTDPTNVVATWIDLKDYEGFAAQLFRSLGTGSVTSFKILAATTSTGTGSTEVKAHAIGSAPNAVGDQIFLECTAENVRSLGADFRYVNAEIALVTGTDECVVNLIRYGANKVYPGLTADYIS